jgi:hypothetical protein
MRLAGITQIRERGIELRDVCQPTTSAVSPRAIRPCWRRRAQGRASNVLPGGVPIRIEDPRCGSHRRRRSAGQIERAVAEAGIAALGE